MLQSQDREQVNREWVTFTGSEKRLILQALKQVSGVCNYANTKDKRGFSKPDASLGNKLARYSYLTDGQAYKAKELLKKYWRQIDGWLYDAIYNRRAEPSSMETQGTQVVNTETNSDKKVELSQEKIQGAQSVEKADSSVLKQEDRKSRSYDVAFWRPAEGETLEGKVVEMGKTVIRDRETEYLQLETNNGKFTVFVNSALRNLINDENVKVGNRIVIKFLGFVQSKKSKWQYKDYVLAKADSNDL